MSTVFKTSSRSTAADEPITSFTTEDGEVVEALRCPETGEVLYKPYYEAIFEQHESCLDIIGFKRPIMIPVFPAYTSSGKKLAQLPSLEDIEHRGIGSGYRPCKYGHYRKVNMSDKRAVPQNMEPQCAHFVIPPGPPETCADIYLSYTSRPKTNVS